MKTIHEFLKGGGSKEPKSGQKGRFSDWLPFHTLILKGDALHFVEVRVLGLRGSAEYECVEIPVTPGPFLIECRGAAFGGDIRIAAMRAYAAGTTPKRGEKLKDIPFDLGGIAVVDIAAVYDSMREDERRYEKWLEALVYKTANESLAAIAEWKPTKTEIPYVDGGFGDGGYRCSSSRPPERLWVSRSSS